MAKAHRYRASSTTKCMPYLECKLRSEVATYTCNPSHGCAQPCEETQVPDEVGTRMRPGDITRVPDALPRRVADEVGTRRYPEEVTRVPGALPRWVPGQVGTRRHPGEVSPFRAAFPRLNMRQ